MSSFDFWSLISLVGITQALVLFAFFVGNRKNYFFPNVFIVLLLLWMIWIQIEFLVVRRSFVIDANFFFGSRHGIWLLLGPLVYHYVLSITKNLDCLPWKALLHYLPFFIFVVILPLTGTISISDRVISYGMLSVLKFPILANSWLDKTYGYIFVFQFVHATAYLVVSLRTIITFQSEQHQSSSDNRQEKIVLLKGLVIAMSISTIASIIFIVVLLNSQWYKRELDFVYILPPTFCIYLISYFAIQQPFTFIRKPIPTNYKKISIHNGLLAENFAKLKELILREKLYLNPELRLNDLSEISEATPHQISEMINTLAGVSFFEFINQMRVHEVIKTIRIKSDGNQRINILEIAYASGFNNKVSFNRYFKKQTGLTPSAYIQKSFIKKG